MRSLKKSPKASWILIIVVLHCVSGVTHSKDNSAPLPPNPEDQITALASDILSPELRVSGKNWKWQIQVYNPSNFTSISEVKHIKDSISNPDADLGGGEDLSSDSDLLQTTERDSHNANGHVTPISNEPEGPTWGNKLNSRGHSRNELLPISTLDTSERKFNPSSHQSRNKPKFHPTSAMIAYDTISRNQNQETNFEPDESTLKGDTEAELSKSFQKLGKLQQQAHQNQNQDLPEGLALMPDDDSPFIPIEESESLRLIPQLVNVTTENVYVSVENDDEDDNLSDKFGHTVPFSSGENPAFSQYPAVRLADEGAPPVITVNSSGVFPLVSAGSNSGDIGEDNTEKEEEAEEDGGNGGEDEQFPDRNFTTWGDKTPKLSINKPLFNESLEGVTIIDQLGDAGLDAQTEAGPEDANNNSQDGEGPESGKTLMMRRRPRRSVVHLYDMVVCATGCNPLMYKGYGCFCGFMGSGLTVDGIDKCCFKHDWCYHHAKCPPLLTYFVPYYWTCNAGRPKCVSDFRSWQGICGAHLCECDRQFAECLRKYPCPNSRAMCMTSPWRFWQNIMMPSHYYG